MIPDNRVLFEGECVWDPVILWVFHQQVNGLSAQGEQARVRRQVCHLSEVVVAEELTEGDRSCQMCGLGWGCLGR